MITRMRCFTYVLLVIPLHTNAVIDDFEGKCGTLVPPWLRARYSWWPLPSTSGPSVGKSYILKYEYQEFFASQPAWLEEYFDHKKERAKIKAVSLGVEFVDIYDFAAQTVTSYKARKPSTSGWDPQTQDECGIYDIKTFRSKYLHMGFPCVPKHSKTCKMPTAEQALRYGGSYRYSFKRSVIDSSTRNIKSKLYTACIEDEFLNGTYESYYYWGGEDLSFPFPSGGKEMPVYVEQHGKYWNHTKEDDFRTSKNIPWYQKDPAFSDDMFQIPPSMHCYSYTELHKFPAMPDSFSFSQEEIGFNLNSTGFLEGGFSPLSFKRIWYSNNLTYARVDMKPSQDDKVGPILNNVTGINGHVSIVLDYTYDLAFLAHSSNDECQILHIDKNFFLCNGEGNKCEKISREKLFGMTGNLSYKGKYKESGIEGETWSRLEVDEKNPKMKSRHEVSFQAATPEVESNKARKEFIPTRQADYRDSVGQDEQEFKQEVRIINYYEFNRTQPELDIYVKHPCLQRYKSKFYTLEFDGPGLAETNKARFLPQLWKAIKNVCKPETMLRFELLDLRSPVWISEKVVYLRILDAFKENETNTDTFFSRIKEHVDAETFAVCFKGLTKVLEEKEMQWIATNFTLVDVNPEIFGTTPSTTTKKPSNKIEKCLF
uniref:Putative conserved secreted protein n=1 Tax=Ixodes ricinus TaxID=34613 RepID=A0A6B0VFN8_IXORI